MRNAIAAQVFAGFILLTTGTCVPSADLPGLAAEERAELSRPDAAVLPPEEAAPKPPPQITVADIMQDGVVIVVSNASQQMHVFRDGSLWRSSPVSTGKRGKETPTGVFAILQKKTFHRSNLYSNAPMPFMQRLTWDGIAIHAGHLPGYPASHGCIRLPREFASALFKLTGFTSTGVIVVEEPLEDERAAWNLAKATRAPIPIDAALLEELPPRVATKEHELKFRPRAFPARDTSPAPAQASPASGEPTIQLAAAPSEAEARAHWAKAVRAEPKLADMRMAIERATVDGRQYYRLRASSPEARTVCEDLKATGMECFPVS